MKITLNTLNTIVDDILLTYRNSNISESENLSRVQIEQWIHQYRAYLLRQELNKGYDINDEYVQSFGPFHISKVSKIPGKEEWISDKELPKFLDLAFGTGLIAVKDMFGNLIQVGDETKAKMQLNRKYTCNDYISYIKNKHLYLLGPGYLEYVEIVGILEDPTDAGDCFDADGKYPVPANLIPVIKEMIFSRELRIMLQMPTDDTNNSTNDTRPVA